MTCVFICVCVCPVSPSCTVRSCGDSTSEQLSSLNPGALVMLLEPGCCLCKGSNLQGGRHKRGIREEVREKTRRGGRNQGGGIK